MNKKERSKITARGQAMQDQEMEEAKRWMRENTETALALCTLVNRKDFVACIRELGDDEGAGIIVGNFARIGFYAVVIAMENDG